MGKRILITGADGMLGGKLSRKLIDETDCDILAVGINRELFDNMCRREALTEGNRIRFMSNEDLLARDDLPEIHAAVHLAFARRNRPCSEIASSLDHAAAVFHKLAALGVEKAINMSSQGVYGNTPEIRTEETAPSPENQYTMAKYASEILFNDILGGCACHTNFRLDLVAQSQNVMKGLCKSAREGRIRLRGGRQVFSFIDAEDVPTALLAMLKTDDKWERVYNVGWNQQRYTLVELAEAVADGTVACGYPRPEIELEEADIAIWAGMCSERFMAKTGWKPVVTMEETIKKIMTEGKE